MSVALERFCCILRFIELLQVGLFTCIGVAGRGFPISSNVLITNVAFPVLIKRATHSPIRSWCHHIFNHFLYGENSYIVVFLVKLVCPWNSPQLWCGPEIMKGKIHHCERIAPCHFYCILWCHLDVWHINPTIFYGLGCCFIPLSMVCSNWSKSYQYFGFYCPVII